MKFYLFGIEISLSFWFFTALLTFVILGRAPLALYFILPVVIHECGHLIAMALCNVKTKAVRFRSFGIDVIRNPAPVSYAKDIIICLGGVSANLLTALCFYFFAFQSLRVIFFIAVNIAIAIFNAMPVANLDGGQVLRLLLERFGNPAKAYAVSRLFSFLLLIPLFGASIFLILRGFANLSLLAACLYLAGVVIFGE